MRSQTQKAKLFRALHQAPNAFIVPNPWDRGTAMMLQQLGFQALATTSAGFAFSRGRSDNSVGRDETMQHIAEIANATDLPVSADLENGFGDSPEAAAETIRRAAAMGAVGGSIEDATGRDRDPIYEMPFAAERVRAACEGARKLDLDFILTARAENYLHGRPDLADTIRRLQAYQEAGADVLYAPGLKTKSEIESVVRSVDRPVNVVAGLQGVRLSVAELAAIGVKRISLGSALYRAAVGEFLRAAGEIKGDGSFAFADRAVPYGELNKMFSRE